MAKAVQEVKQKQDPQNGAVKLEPIVASIDIPTLHATHADGTRPYAQRRVDLTLTHEEAEIMRDIYDGIAATGHWKGRPAPQAEVLRYILKAVAKKMPKPQ